MCTLALLFLKRSLGYQSGGTSNLIAASLSFSQCYGRNDFLLWNFSFIILKSENTFWRRASNISCNIDRLNEPAAKYFTIAKSVVNTQSNTIALPGTRVLKNLVRKRQCTCVHAKKNVNLGVILGSMLNFSFVLWLNNPDGLVVTNSNNEPNHIIN